MHSLLKIQLRNRRCTIKTWGQNRWWPLTSSKFDFSPLKMRFHQTYSNLCGMCKGIMLRHQNWWKILIRKILKLWAALRNVLWWSVKVATLSIVFWICTCGPLSIKHLALNSLDGGKMYLCRCFWDFHLEVANHAGSSLHKCSDVCANLFTNIK